MVTNTTTEKPRSRPVDPEVLPTEQPFWTHYSPHHEFPLSTVVSLAIHAIGFCVLVLAASALWEKTRQPPVEIGVAGVVGPGTPTGDGRPSGASPAGDPGSPDPDPGQTSEPVATVPTKPTERLQNPVKNDQQPITVPESQPNPKAVNISGLTDLNKEATAAVAKAVQSGSKGPKGTNGANGTGGNGTGSDGPGDGSGSRGGAIRAERQSRWNVTFNTTTQSYKDQLLSIKAVLAYPVGENQFVVLRPESNYRGGKAEDLSQFKQIYWVDNSPHSVGRLASELGISPLPAFIAAFFPFEVEEDMQKKEKAFLHSHHPTAKEGDIALTRFEFRRHGGKFDFLVTQMQLHGR